MMNGKENTEVKSMKKRMQALLVLVAVLFVSVAPGGKVLAAEDSSYDDYEDDGNYEDDEDYDDGDYDDEDYDDEDYDDEDYDDEEDDLTEGDLFVTNGYEYEILTINYDNSKGTVKLVDTESDKIKNLNVPATVTEEEYGYKFTVTEIEEEACEGYKKLKTVKIPDTVTVIGKEAFENCKSLKSVTIGKGLITIGEKAFYRDKKLNSIKITSKKIKKVGNKAFASIHKKCVFKVPASKLKSYQKLFQKRGAGKKVVFKKA